MNTVYEFKDWTSAARMKNSKNPRLKIDVGVLRTHDGSGILGYQLTVYDIITQEIEYKFYIDYGEPHSWSLVTDEAIDFLNQIGFNCNFIKDTITLTPKAREVLESLKSLGYNMINKDYRPAQLIVTNTDPKNFKVNYLSDITKDYNYHDFWFVTDILTPIQYYLDEANGGISND